MKLRRPLKKLNKGILCSGLVISALLLGVACSDKPKMPAKTPSPQATKQPITPTQPKPEEVKQEPPKPVFTYNPVGRRDPFMPLIVREEKQGKGKMADRPPLERFNISEFKLTGIVWGGFGYNAMLEGPDGKGYFVHVGTVIGQNRGVITKITKSSLIVEEKYKDYMGVLKRKEIIVELRKRQEGKP